MMQGFFGNREASVRAINVLAFTAALILAPVLLSSETRGQVLSYASPSQNQFPADGVVLTPGETADDVGGAVVLPERLRRTTVSFESREAPGTIIIDTGNTALYYVLGQGRAIRYGIRRGTRGLHLVGRANHHPQGGMAGLVSAGGNARAPALSATVRGGRPRQSAGCARHVSGLQRLSHSWHQRSLDDW